MINNLLKDIVVYYRKGLEKNYGINDNKIIKQKAAQQASNSVLVIATIIFVTLVIYFDIPEGKEYFVAFVLLPLFFIPVLFIAKHVKKIINSYSDQYIEQITNERTNAIVNVIIFLVTGALCIIAMVLYGILSIE